MKNKDGHLCQQNGDFVFPIIGNKIDDSVNNCYFQVFYCMIFYLR